MKTIRTIFIGLFILFLFSSLIRNIIDYQSKQQFYQDYKKEFDNEKKQNITLQTEILKKTSQYEVEKTIRNKLNLLKPNEVAIMLPTPTPTSVVVIPTPQPNWKQWWVLFTK